MRWFPLALLLVACSVGSDRLASTKIPPEKVRDNEQRPAPGPDYSPRPGLQELGDAGLDCFNMALAHNPVFARGGFLVVQWRADANGDLLALDFTRDSFGDWEIDAEGQTMAGCISKKVEAATVRWSRLGTAPLRFSPAPASQPASQPGS